VCGIGGYVAAREARFDRTRATRVLLAGIAERGRDACGVAFRAAGGPVSVRKDARPFAAMVEEVAVPAEASQVLVHIRDFTKGAPRIPENNHPIVHGAVTGVHNGRVHNDEELFARFGVARAHVDMTVDSEAIFMLLDRATPAHVGGSAPRALEQLVGSMACAWLDDRDGDAVHIARGVLRPLWVGLGRGVAAWSSNADGLRYLESVVGMPFLVRPVLPGEILHLRAGRIAGRERFRVDHDFRETNPATYRRGAEEFDLLARLAG
jgi:glucosamine 6-phosphate synthetase-like amidotransferase/phosphosugar isomerase protein